MQARWLGLLVVGALLFGACGDDEGGAVDAGTDAGKAGKGGSGGGGTGGTAVEEITCGTKKCTAPEIDLAGLLPDTDGGMPNPLASFITPDTLASFGAAPMVCCSGKDEDTCGVSAMAITGGMCIQQDQEGKPDAVCPTLTNNIAVMGLEFPLMLPGCCRPDNKCGVDIALLGVGCVERVAASNLAMMTSSMFDAGPGGTADAGAPLESIDCVYTPSTDDGGTDAGN